MNLNLDRSLSLNDVKKHMIWSSLIISLIVHILVNWSYVESLNKRNTGQYIQIYTHTHTYSGSFCQDDITMTILATIKQCYYNLFAISVILTTI